MIMKNLLADREQKTAAYRINPENYRIHIYLSNDQTAVILADKDNNYAEWLSIGS